MQNAKKIKDDIAAQGHQIDNDTLRQKYILPNFERGEQAFQQRKNSLMVHGTLGAA
jgi:hypothetical protein